MSNNAGFLRRLLELMSQTQLFRRVRNRYRYPGLGIHPSVNLDVRGDFSYEKASINVGCNIFISEGTTLTLGKECYLGRYVELGPSSLIEIGDLTSIQDRCIFLGNVKIGRYCLFAPNIYISSGKHHYEDEPLRLIRDQDSTARNRLIECMSDLAPVVVEDDCWIGINVVIMRGVTIGKGAIVGANAVVTKDVMPYTVVAGIPAKLIKKRLEFIPPRTIAFDSTEDMPYFYSGFFQLDAESQFNMSAQGMLARQEFTLCLSNIGRRIHLIVKTINCTTCSLRFKGNEKEIKNQFEEISFDLFPPVSDRFSFIIFDAIPDATVAVQRAWIER